PVVAGHAVHGGPAAVATLASRAGLVLAEVGSGCQAAADSGPFAAGRRQESGRLAADGRAGRQGVVACNGGAVVPLALAERGLVPHLQTDDQRREVSLAHGGPGASRGRGVAAGRADSAGARHVGAAPPWRTGGDAGERA